MHEAFTPVAAEALPHARNALALLEQGIAAAWADHHATSGEMNQALDHAHRLIRILDYYSRGEHTPEFTAALTAFRNSLG